MWRDLGTDSKTPSSNRKTASPLSRKPKREKLWFLTVTRTNERRWTGWNLQVVHYARGTPMSTVPTEVRDYCVLRTWRNDLPRGTCVVAETSIEHVDAPVMADVTRGIALASRYLIEPCGAGKSRLVHLIRVDTKYALIFLVSCAKFDLCFIRLNLRNVLPSLAEFHSVQADLTVFHWVSIDFSGFYCLIGTNYWCVRVP